MEIKMNDDILSRALENFVVVFLAWLVFIDKEKMLVKEQYHQDQLFPPTQSLQ